MIDMEIVSECTGLHETVFLSLLILCFRGVKPMVRVKWAIYAVIFIFIENLIRIISGYPLIHLYGFSTWDKFHYFWWHTGQYALIMSLFVLWVMIVAGNPKNKSLKKNLVR
jgi:exosortase/archaeosortase family protein